MKARHVGHEGSTLLVTLNGLRLLARIRGVTIETARPSPQSLTPEASPT